MLRTLFFQNFRCLNASIDFSTGLNVIHGCNAGGKSSILEGIHYLSCGRSFRTASPSSMIASGTGSFILRAAIKDNDQEHVVAVQRHDDKTVVKLNGAVSSLSKISALLPSVFIDSHSHRMFFGTTAYRRTLFDWLAFHVKHSHMHSVRRYTRALRSRNHALKEGGLTRHWDRIMSEEAVEITANRRKVLDLVSPSFQRHLQSFSLPEMGLLFEPGHIEGESLMDALCAASHLDRHKGRTSVGPHVCNWLVTCDDADVSGRLSQGQQKMTYFALTLSIYESMIQAGLSPVFLMDDFSAELDARHQSLVEGAFSSVVIQGVVTAVNLGLSSDAAASSVFHVKHGVVSLSC